MVGGAELLATTEWKSWWVGWRAARCATHTFTTLPRATFSSASASTTWKLGHRPLQDTPLWQELLTMMLTFQQIFPFSGSSYIGHHAISCTYLDSSPLIDRGFKPKCLQRLHMIIEASPSSVSVCQGGPKRGLGRCPNAN